MLAVLKNFPSPAVKLSTSLHTLLLAHTTLPHTMCTIAPYALDSHLIASWSDEEVQRHVLRLWLRPETSREQLDAVLQELDDRRTLWPLVQGVPNNAWSLLVTLLRGCRPSDLLRFAKMYGNKVPKCVFLAGLRAASGSEQTTKAFRQVFYA